jgi:hypothetical protein
MRRLISLVLAVAVAAFPSFLYIYAKGYRDGIEHYKRSNSFVLTLESAYVYGLRDGCSNKSLCGRGK